MALAPGRDDRGSWLTLGALALWLTVLTLAPHSSFRGLHIAVHYALLPCLLAFQAFRRRREGAFGFGWPDASMVLYLALALGSVLWAEKPGPTRLHLFAVFRNILVPFAAFWLIRIAPPGAGQLRALVPLMAALSLWNVLVSVLAWFAPAHLPPVWPALLSDAGEIRLTGTFTNPDILAGALALFSGFLLHDALHRGAGAHRMLLLSAAGLNLACIFMTFSRTSWIALAFFLLLAALLYGKMLIGRDLVGFLPAAALLALVLAVPPKSIAEQEKRESRTLPARTEETRVSEGGSQAKGNRPAPALEEGGRGSRANTARLLDARIASTSQIRSRIITGYAGLRMFAEKPVGGWGYETYDIHARRFVKPLGSLKVTAYEMERAPSHNTFITILAETGAPGLILYTFPLAWWALAAFRKRRSLRSLPGDPFVNSRFQGMLWASLAFILLVGQSIDLRFFPFTLVEIWLLLGLIANQVRPLAGGHTLGVYRGRRNLGSGDSAGSCAGA